MSLVDFAAGLSLPANDLDSVNLNIDHSSGCARVRISFVKFVRAHLKEHPEETGLQKILDGLSWIDA